MDSKPPSQTEQSINNANELRYQRGYRDGHKGLNMSSTTSEYRQGYIDGRRIKLEEKIRSDGIISKPFERVRTDQ